MNEMDAEQLRLDVKAIDKKHPITLNYWGPISSKSVGVEPVGDNLRLVIRLWKKLKEDDGEYDHSDFARNESEIGGMSIVVPPGYNVEWLQSEISRLSIS